MHAFDVRPPSEDGTSAIPCSAGGFSCPSNCPRPPCQVYHPRCACMSLLQQSITPRQRQREQPRLDLRSLTSDSRQNHPPSPFTNYGVSQGGPSTCDKSYVASDHVPAAKKRKVTAVRRQKLNSLFNKTASMATMRRSQGQQDYATRLPYPFEPCSLLEGAPSLSGSRSVDLAGLSQYHPCKCPSCGSLDLGYDLGHLSSSTAAMTSALSRIEPAGTVTQSPPGSLPGDFGVSHQLTGCPVLASNSHLQNLSTSGENRLHSDQHRSTVLSIELQGPTRRVADFEGGLALPASDDGPFFALDPSLSWPPVASIESGDQNSLDRTNWNSLFHDNGKNPLPTQEDFEALFPAQTQADQDHQLLSFNPEEAFWSDFDPKPPFFDMAENQPTYEPGLQPYAPSLIATNTFPSLEPETDYDTSLSSSNRSNERINYRDMEKDAFLIECKSKGMSYKDIKQQGGFVEAESTLRGRYRTLTKPREQRLRKPEWQDRDVQLLLEAVSFYAATSGERARLSAADGEGVVDPDTAKIPWKLVAEFMAARGSYKFGNATVKKKYLEQVGQGNS